MATAARTGRRIDVDTLRRFATPALLTGTQFLTGLIEVPVTAGRWSASVVFGQDDGRGALAYLTALWRPAARRDSP